MLLLEKYRTSINDMNVDQVKHFIKRLIPEYDPSCIEVNEEIAVTKNIQTI